MKNIKNFTNIKNIKNIFENRKIIAGLIVVITSLFLASCYTPNPLYGTWTDNEGNSIQFQADGSFTATILNSSQNPIDYQGTYDVVDNVLIFHITGDKEYSRNTEWDIRGAMLYLTWTANNVTKSITLYHTAR